jgi:hypothetical protein
VRPLLRKDAQREGRRSRPSRSLTDHFYDDSIDVLASFAHGSTGAARQSPGRPAHHNRPPRDASPAAHERSSEADDDALVGLLAGTVSADAALAAGALAVVSGDAVELRRFLDLFRFADPVAA